MKKIILSFCVGLVLLSCSTGNERILTSATGTIYECLVVMPNRPLSAEQLALVHDQQVVDERTQGSGYVEPIAATYDLIKATMGAAMPGLPQVEPYFVLTQVPMGQFDDYLKPTRNILIIDINRDKYTQLKVQHSRNTWSKPQAVLRIQAPDDESVVAYWLANGEQVREWFVREELNRQIRFYRANTNKDARAKLNKLGYDMLIPEDYMLIKAEKINISNHQSPITNDIDFIDVLWCCNNKGPMRRDLIVYSYPYTAQSQFDNASICAMRDEVLGQLVSAQVKGSYMGTEYKYFPPQSRPVAALNDSVGGFYAIETRGLWKIKEGEAMGGPFVSLTRLDQVNGRVVTAETFLFASGQKKRNALRQAEAILYTLQMPNERAKTTALSHKGN
ncbi:MAG: DUF4837 family protein [Paludibacteraceae bacterium]|nr:DUF4837 family protein [Paludibacteraceae bacterium]